MPYYHETKEQYLPTSDFYMSILNHIITTYAMVQLRYFKKLKDLLKGVTFRYIVCIACVTMCINITLYSLIYFQTKIKIQKYSEQLLQGCIVFPSLFSNQYHLLMSQFIKINIQSHDNYITFIIKFNII